MKKSFRLLLAAAAAGLASCASDGPVLPQGGDAERFSISIPAEVASRAFSDGSSLKNIYVAVYPADNDNADPYISSFTTSAVNPELVSGGTVNDLSADISIQLVKGKAYNVFFWAESYADGAGPYTFKPSEHTMTVDYSKMVCNSDAPDAFYYYGEIEANGNTHEIKLQRPLTQINIGTDDYDAATLSGLKVTKTAVTFSNLADTFRFTDGSATGEKKDVTLTADIPAAGQSYPVGENKYRYLNMAYVLVNSSAEGNAMIDNVSLSVNGNPAYAPYSNIPVSRNYRTNIYGSLLTDRTNFTVTMTDYTGSINQEQKEFVSVSMPSKLVEAVKAGKNIRLSRNLTFSNEGIQDININTPIIIDLCGYSIDNSKNTPISFKIPQGSKLTIQGNGSMKSYGALFINEGELNIKDGTFQSDSHVIKNNGSDATCIIEQGNFLSESKTIATIYNIGTLIINNGIFISKNHNAMNTSGNVTIKGGKFNGEHAINILSGGSANISEGDFNSSGDKATIYLPFSGIVNITGGRFTNLKQKDDGADWTLHGSSVRELTPVITYRVNNIPFATNYNILFELKWIVEK